MSQRYEVERCEYEWRVMDRHYGLVATKEIAGTSGWLAYFTNRKDAQGHANKLNARALSEGEQT